jgi:hypothetical protein
MHGCPSSWATNSAPIPPNVCVTEIGGVVTAGIVVTLSVEPVGGCVVVVVVVVVVGTGGIPSNERPLFSFSDT